VAGDLQIHGSVSDHIFNGAGLQQQLILSPVEIEPAWFRSGPVRSRS
jgi:hypothetical protein